MAIFNSKLLNYQRVPIFSIIRHPRHSNNWFPASSTTSEHQHACMGIQLQKT